MLKIREATKEDIPDIARIHVDGWHGAYGGIIDQNYIDSLTIEKRIEQWQSRIHESQNLIAYDENKAVGFISYGCLKTPPPGTSKIRPLYSSEIYAIYLKKNSYRKKIGTKLLQEAVNELREQKHNSVCLWVMEKNKQAQFFYAALGGQRIGKRMIEIGPSKVKELCYGWRDISVILEK